MVLVSAHRMALSARDEAHVVADAKELEPDDEFDLVDCGRGLFGLRTLAGKYVTALPSGGVEANRTWLRDWEMFSLVPAEDGRFGLFGFHRRFLRAHPNGKVEATSTALSEWEQFYVQELPGVDSLAPGMLARGQAELPFRLVASAIYDYCRARPKECAEATLKLIVEGTKR